MGTCPTGVNQPCEVPAGFREGPLGPQVSHGQAGMCTLRPPTAGPGQHFWWTPHLTAVFSVPPACSRLTSKPEKLNAIE